MAGLEITRSAGYTFRARLAARFQDGRVFLLGDAAHLTPPFIGQDRAAAVRRIALAAAVRSKHVREAMASTATPRLKTGVLQAAPRLLPSGIPAALRPGGLIPNPLVQAGDGTPVRLDTILDGRTAVLTARPPEPGLVELCRRHGLVLIRISASGTGALADPNADWADVRLAAGQATGLRALTAYPALTVIVRPDRVIAAAELRCRLPRLPWHILATAARGQAAATQPPANAGPARPLPTAF